MVQDCNIEYELFSIPVFCGLKPNQHQMQGSVGLSLLFTATLLFHQSSRMCVRKTTCGNFTRVPVQGFYALFREGQQNSKRRKTILIAVLTEIHEWDRFYRV